MRLRPDSPIDLQLHTIHSDGAWTPEALIDHLLHEGFEAAAITDHDRVDMIDLFQALAQARGFQLLPAVEMSAHWRGDPVDLLCFGVDSQLGPLRSLADKLLHLQQENIRQVAARIADQGYTMPTEAVDAILGQPSVQQPHSLAALARDQGLGTAERSAGRLLLDAGLEITTLDIGEIVAATHAVGGLALVAHPGRGDGYPVFDEALLDQLRGDVPVDGLEVLHPRHNPEQEALYRAYADHHGLLTSAGSDSHHPDGPPIKYPASACQRLLEQLGVRFA